MPIDLIKRFTPTPLTATLSMDGMTLRVATNDQFVLDRLQLSRDAIGDDCFDAPLSEWRIVVDEEDDTPDHDSTLQGFAHDGLSFIRLARGSFIAGDRLANLGISFIERSLIQDDQRFRQTFLAAFLLMLHEMKERVDVGLGP
jgi:hypothetical protein